MPGMPAAPSIEVFMVPVTLMLTTAGPLRAVMVEKSGMVTSGAAARPARRAARRMALALV